MKPILVLAALLGSVLPTSAQSAKLYTNANLTSKPVTFTRSVTPEEWSGLQARAFVAPPSDLSGPHVYVAPWSGDRPGFLPDTNAIVMAGSGSYADDLWRDPVTAYALQHPIEAAYGLSYGRHQGSFFGSARRPTRTAVAQPFSPASTPRPSVTTGASSAGHRVR